MKTNKLQAFIFALREWKHLILIIMAMAFMFSGFAFTSQWFSCSKTKPGIPKLLNEEIK